MGIAVSVILYKGGVHNQICCMHIEWLNSFPAQVAALANPVTVLTVMTHVLDPTLNLYPIPDHAPVHALPYHVLVER